MDINEQITHKKGDQESVTKKASDLFQPFMNDWSKLARKNWKFKEHGVGQGFFIYHYSRTVCSISCSNGLVNVDMHGADQINLPNVPSAVHGVWPSWKRAVSKESLELIGDQLTTYIATRSN